MSLVVHPDVASKLSAFAKQLPQALLLTGKSGVGLSTIARSIEKDFVPHAYLRPELLTKTSTLPQIGVERIRELYTLSRGKRSETAIVIIDDADTMTESAQNSFLKLLEEPPANTHFILTTHSPESLLPTIKSRLQTLHVRAVSPDQTSQLLNALSDIDETQRRQILFMASGLPAEIHRLSSDESYFQIRSERIRLAKQLVEGSVSTRISTVLKQSLTRSEAIAMVTQMIALLELSPQQTSVLRIRKLLTTLERLESGGNIRLQLVAGMV